MIGENLREVVLKLFEEEKTKNEIAKFLSINIKTVRKIIAQGNADRDPRCDKKIINEELLKEVFEKCKGYKQRMLEILKEDHNIVMRYSTLTRIVRQHGLGCKQKERHMSFPDIPGEEMQHDTSEYVVQIGNRMRKIVCSGLYIRYSKMRFVVFYYRFNRFKMKSFFDRALKWFGYTAKVCVIDNTNLAVLYGTGENAVFNDEMIGFANRYGFVWKAHRIKHSNRKAGKERNFLTLETNFFPGRTFKSLEDLNEQAFKWATEHFARRPQSKSNLIPCELFEFEKPYLTKLSEYIEPPYQCHERNIDDYGYVAFDGNYYWTPEGNKGKAKIIEYERNIGIYVNHKKLISYTLPDYDVKNQRIIPPDKKNIPYQPVHRAKGCSVEEKKLKDMGDICASYIEYVKSSECKIPQKPKFIRDLYRFSKKLNSDLFMECISRAKTYSIANIQFLEIIAREIFRSNKIKSLESPSYSEYEDRPSYQQGRFSHEADLNLYSSFLKEQDDE